MYRIREVEAQDEAVADSLAELHQLIFCDGTRVPDFEQGYWWIAFRGAKPIAFAGVIPSTYVTNAGYLCRVGVVMPHCGHGLQVRLTRALEARARRAGWKAIVSDTTDNIFSANNFIRQGYRLFEPVSPWAWQHTLYWRKELV
ncbi:GNAT family N-acetyltransferase [Bradyrhizobium sp. Arg62]|uniref:GNAT family N-acetyltransferase n=1 Tax=Bradyrhizobium brasilense TaxID=1419277 RepID=UPI001E38058D|nr:GNAT family N-acetyltransferase [Bradyrhizobium brasilense]MCC8943744.1 GNAT family N-acetyltransferase [Bradyrhizobium brasilense]MCP3413764.1 GNAT family N-acetyltransferase [Bradyrhizobium brasilense]